jgi:hypothetical protein
MSVVKDYRQNLVGDVPPELQRITDKISLETFHRNYKGLPTKSRWRRSTGTTKDYRQNLVGDVPPERLYNRSLVIGSSIANSVPSPTVEWQVS